MQPNAFPALKDIGFEDNLELPVHVFHETAASLPHQTLREYFASVHGAPDPRVKIAVVGQGNVGKTQLARRLAGLTPDPVWKSTTDFNRFQVVDGVALAPTVPIKEIYEQSTSEDDDLVYIADEDVPPGSIDRFESPADEWTIPAHVLDMGGQPWLLGSHRFFLSNHRTVHLVVARADLSLEDNRVSFWLDSFAHEYELWNRWRPGSLRPPIVVVVTRTCDLRGRKVDPCTLRLDFDRLRALCRETEAILVEDYDNFEIGEAGLTCVRTALAQSIRKARELFDTRVGVGWRFLREQIEDLFGMADREGEPWNPLPARWLMWSEYLAMLETGMAKLAEQHRSPALKDAEEFMERAVSQAAWLRDLGIVHWIGDRRDLNAVDSGVKMVLFNPLYVKGPVYRMLSPDVPLASEPHRPWSVSEDTLIRAINAALSDQGDEAGVEIGAARFILDLMIACQLVFRTGRFETSGESELMCVPDRVPEGKPPGSRSPVGPNETQGVIEGVFIPDWFMPRLIGVMAPVVEVASRTQATLRVYGNVVATIVADQHRRCIWCSIFGGSADERAVCFGQLDTGIQGLIGRRMRREVHVDVGSGPEANPRKPTAKELIAYRLLMTGLKQAVVVTEMAKRGYRITQGEVSRAKHKCDKWLSHFGVLPEYRVQARSQKPSSLLVDRDSLDIGKREDHRPPHVGEKAKQDRDNA